METEVTVVEPHPQNSDQMIVTVGLFVTGHAFPAWASAHLAQMAPRPIGSGILIQGVLQTTSGPTWFVEMTEVFQYSYSN